MWSYVYRCDLHHGWQSMALAFTRTVLMGLCNNFSKFEYWRKELKRQSRTNNNNIYTEYNKVKNDVLHMKYINEKYGHHLIRKIKVDDDELFNLVLEKIRSNKLKFQYKWEPYGPSEHYDLMEYVYTRPTDWVLNEQSLQIIFDKFDGRFSKDTLREKLFSFGKEYKF